MSPGKGNGMSSSLSIVYVLTNSAMPGLVKIGYTSQDDANSRIAQLYTTGVPVPFTIEYACKVQNAEEVEKALHVAFGPNRINPKREFFRIEPDQAIAILKAAYREFVERVGETAEPRGSKTQLVLEVIGKMSGTFSLADLERACPGVSRDMIRRVLNTQKGQTVDCIGRGPGALWQKR